MFYKSLAIDSSLCLDAVNLYKESVSGEHLNNLVSYVVLIVIFTQTIL